ncbi:MAG: LPS export ABC transporter periplasmic protein LptC [Candidatus Latescibacteria bacterium]|nr:LPS export ABC transporter periplasmic protein LptC [Candidatus Latescibacterota bacterium]
MKRPPDSSLVTRHSSLFFPTTDHRPPRRWLILLVSSALWLCGGCGSSPSIPESPARNADAPDQETWDATIYLLQDGKQRVVVTASYIAHSSRSRQTKLEQGLRIEFYDQDGQRTSTLTADRGTIDEQTRTMSAIGHVVVTNTRGGTLETDSLQWVENLNRIRTDAPVRISTDKDVITGIGFEADPNLERWEITRNVQGRFDRGEEISKRVDELRER